MSVSAPEGRAYIHYLAYGSNLLPRRLVDRVPSARLIGVAGLPGHRLAFHKIGMDGSGKCDLVLADRDRDQAWLAVYRIRAAERAMLDRFEGPGYAVESMTVRISDRAITGFVYRARPQRTDPSMRPFHWYRQLVLMGAHYHGFPPDYLAAIERVESVPDPDPERDERHRRLLPGARE